MSRHTQRSFYSDNGILTDITIPTNDYRRDSATVLAWEGANDYLYVGADWTFNGLHFDLSALNTNPSIVTVELWSGVNNGWMPAVSVLDYTNIGGISLARNGHITWDRDPDEPWHRESESQDIAELASGPDLRSFYWMRFSWSADLTAGLTFDHLGFKFSNDDDLYSFYPELNNTRLLTQWETGKTSWDEQSFMAADILIRDLKKQNVIDFRGQMLDFELWKDAAIHKTAEIIFAGMGSPRNEERQAAAGSYEMSKNLKQPRVDLSADARLTQAEKVKNKGFMRR